MSSNYDNFFENFLLFFYTYHAQTKKTGNIPVLSLYSQ